MATGIALIPLLAALTLSESLRNATLRCRPRLLFRAWPLMHANAGSLHAKPKRTIEERMLQCLRQRNGEYDPTSWLTSSAKAAQRFTSS
jgi:hypothetical protein